MKLNSSHFLLVLLSAILVVFVGCSQERKKTKHFTRANEAFAAGKYDLAEIEYLNVLRLEQTNQVALRNLALMAFEQGRLGRAFAMLNEAKKNDPDDFQVRLKLAQFALAGEDMAQARTEAVQLLEKDPANDELLQLLGDSSITSEHIKDTEQRLARLTSATGLAGYHLAIATLRVRQQNFPEAEAAFKKALSIDPKSSATHAAMGNYYALRQKRSDAEAAYKKAAEFAPARSPHRLAYVDFQLAVEDFATAKTILEQIAQQTPDYLPAQLRLAQLALLEQRYKPCEEWVQKVLDRDPTHLEGMLLLARMWSAQNEHVKARAVLEQVVKNYPRIPQVYHQMALAQLHTGDLPGAVNSLGQALKIQPSFADAILLLAEINMRRGDTAVAIASLTRLVSQRPDLPEAQFVLATAYQTQGNWNEALKIFQNLNRLDPKNTQVLWRTGIALQQLGRKIDARKNYEAALAIAPDFLPALEELLRLELDEKRYAVARERVEKELKGNPNNPAFHLFLARVHLAETNYASAESALLKAIKLAPDSEDSHALMGQIYVATHRQKEALKKFQNVVADQPDHAPSWLQIAKLHENAGEYTAAKTAYEKILAANPQHTVALNNLAWLYAENLNDPKQAQDLAGKARRIQPADPAIADTLGWAFYKGGDYPRALELLKESAGKLPQEPQIQFHLGMVHYQMGDEQAAKAAFQNVVASAEKGMARTEAEDRLKVLAVNVSTGDAKAVADEMDRLSKRFPNDPLIFSKKAALFERDGHWKKAASTYEEAVKANPNFVSAMVKLARIYSTHLQDPQQALVWAKRARKLEPTDPNLGHLLGKLTFDSATSEADYQSAFSLLQDSAQRLPADSEVTFHLAWAAYAIGQWEESVAIMRRVEKTSTLSASAEKFVWMAALLTSAEAEANATRIQEVLAADPNFVPAWMAAGLAQEKRAEFKTACESYERVLKRFPLFSPAVKRLAQLYYDPIRDTTMAYGFASRARTAFPQDAQIARILGLLEYDRAKYSRAAQLLDESSRSLTTDADIFYRLGMAHHQLKQSLESKRALTKALELSPASPLANDAKRLLAELK